MSEDSAKDLWVPGDMCAQSNVWCFSRLSDIHFRTGGAVNDVDGACGLRTGRGPTLQLLSECAVAGEC